MSKVLELDLGALVCVPKNPKCNECPLAVICDYAITNADHVSSSMIDITKDYR